MIDIIDPVEVNIMISADGNRLWVCTDKHLTILRIKGITKLTIDDLRRCLDEQFPTEEL